MHKVSIPEPCNENWNEMTPSEKGAFCGKCQIDVIDFTNKSNTEIKTILLENNGKKMCGHIKASQLKQLNTDYAIWENQTTKVFYSKFAWACVLVFGMTLFTGCNESIMPGQQHVVGKMEMHFADTSTNINEPLEIINGQVDIQEDTLACSSASDTNKTSTCEPKTIDNELLGDIDIDGKFLIEPDYYNSIDSSEITN